MISIGIDIGSRTVKLIKLVDCKITGTKVRKNTFNHQEIVEELLQDEDYDVLTATGYGRHFFDDCDNCHIITEIKAFATGVFHLFPNCRTILDIGGQDTKAILLDSQGRMIKFIMNDKCAAGTGRFLEIMAVALNYEIEEFGKAAATAQKDEKINSMCTVFAESEVISLLSKGADRGDVARGIHQSIVKRSASLLQKIGIDGEVAFVGGVAFNLAMKQLLELELGYSVTVPENPQIIGALGCALYGMQKGSNHV